MLFRRDAPADDLVVRGARVLDPAQGIDAKMDVRIDGGIVAALGTDLHLNRHRILEGGGLVLAPAFVDPHVHLRTPGGEEEETIATWRPSIRPSCSRMVYRSSSACVGCWCVPSPAFTTCACVARATRCGAPICGWRITITSGS